MALTACGDDSDSGGEHGIGRQRDPAPKARSASSCPTPSRRSAGRASTGPALEAAFKAAGVEYDIQNAQGDEEKMTQIADSMIANGVTVLAIVNLDSESGAAIEEKAASQGVPTIDYDRLTLGGSADYYVSFDNTKVGELQGQGLADCLGDKDGQHHLPQRLADRQQRHAVLGRCARACSTRSPTTRSSASRPSRLGQRGGSHDLRAALHRCGRQGRRRARRQRRSRRRRDQRARGATAWPARSRSPVRTPPSRVCRTSSPAPSA